MSAPPPGQPAPDWLPEPGAGRRAETDRRQRQRDVVLQSGGVFRVLQSGGVFRVLQSDSVFRGPDGVFRVLQTGDVFRVLQSGGVFRVLQSGDVFRVLQSGGVFRVLHSDIAFRVQTVCSGSCRVVVCSGSYRVVMCSGSCTVTVRSGRCVQGPDGVFRVLQSGDEFRVLQSDGAFRVLQSGGAFRVLQSGGVFRVLQSGGVFRVQTMRSGSCRMLVCSGYRRCVQGLAVWRCVQGPDDAFRVLQTGDAFQVQMMRSGSCRLVMRSGSRRCIQGPDEAFQTRRSGSCSVEMCSGSRRGVQVPAVCGDAFRVLTMAFRVQTMHSGSCRLVVCSGSCSVEMYSGSRRGVQGPDDVFRVLQNCLSLSPSWLGRPVFLPHWNYIPHHAPGQSGARGHVELIGSPVLLGPGPEQRLAAHPGEAGLSNAVGVRDAIVSVQSRTRGRRLSVWGRVLGVCPLLVVSGTSFFVFSLTDGRQSVSVLVRERSQLWWAQCVCVGQSVCVTSLRVCVLRGWRGNNILCATQQSELHTDYTHTSSQATPPTLMMSHVGDDGGEEAGPQRDSIQSSVRTKRSRVISYQGTVTEVVSEGAGLYVMDGKVGLCLAYQPTLRRKLRAGDGVELHHVHFLYRPCPDFPPSMLCTCLRSSLRVTTFSRVGGASPEPRCPGDAVLPRLLLEKNVGVSEYLWTCHLSSRLSTSLLPTLQRHHCVCVLSWKLMENIWRRRRGRRDIYSEMLDETHSCPLTQYSADPSVHQFLSVSDLCRSLQSHCWSSVSLSSLLPPGGSGLTSSQINMSLAWSCSILPSDPRTSPQTGHCFGWRPLLLVGVLELPSPDSESLGLILRDGTGTVSCVTTETSQEEEGGQRASFNTAWIGCLVCVLQFTMVTERFIQSEFPSVQHLDQDRFITHRRCRVYLQFSLDHLCILSPSVAMVTHLHQRGAGPEDDITEEGHTSGRKRPRAEEENDSAPSASSTVTKATIPVGGSACVSMVIMVEHKEGVAWRNVGVESKQGEAGLKLSFSLRAAMIGPVVCWGRDPKNGPMTDREAETDREDRVVLVFSGVLVRWFPVLQPGCFYRLVATDTQDPSVFIGCGVSGQRGVELHTDSTLQVQPDWRFHTLTRPLLLLPDRQVIPSSVLSVSQVLDSRSELVSFQGQVSDRIHLKDRTLKSGDPHAGVRLTVCDHTGRSLQVYLDLSHTPYPPGLLPGNTLLLSAFQRKESRTGSVYCVFVAVSSVTVVSLRDQSSAPPPPAPMMHLGVWADSREQRCMMGQVRGHVVCFLFLLLQWSCSLCGNVYRQSCSSSHCSSTSAFFQSEAKLVVDDGTGEAHVRVSGGLVRTLLGLAESQWEGLQRALRVRGHAEIYSQGRSPVCDPGDPGDPGDPVLHFLLLCSSDAGCRQFRFTCRKLSSHRPEGLHDDLAINGCSESDGEFMYAVDGEEVWFADFINKKGVEPQPSFVQHVDFPGFYENAVANQQICKQNLKTVQEAYKDTPLDNDPPSSPVVYPKDDLVQGEENVLVCYVTGFYPAPVTFSWTKNGKNVTEGTSVNVPYPNKDGSFHQTSRLDLVPQQGDVYSCSVKHLSLQEPLTRLWDVDLKQSSVGPDVFCGLGLTLGLLGVAAGTFFLIKGNECS
ncbi:uncharacterized protein V6R79_006747 [Siganus canaliculatus]